MTAKKAIQGLRAPVCIGDRAEHRRQNGNDDAGNRHRIAPHRLRRDRIARQPGNEIGTEDEGDDHGEERLRRPVEQHPAPEAGADTFAGRRPSSLWPPDAAPDSQRVERFSVTDRFLLCPCSHSGGNRSHFSWNLARADCHLALFCARSLSRPAATVILASVVSPFSVSWVSWSVTREIRLRSLSCQAPTGLRSSFCVGERRDGDVLARGSDVVDAARKSHGLVLLGCRNALGSGQQPGDPQVLRHAKIALRRAVPASRRYRRRSA